MRRVAATLAVAIALFAAAAPGALAAEWRSEQPIGGGIGIAVQIGEVGDIEMWAPNAGMLITAGNDGVGAGLWAYDGTGWYRYSNVCGGHQGRIAGVGPADFWTISDQQVKQPNGKPPGEHLSLCHFVNGVVVTSYAEPIGSAAAYLPMDAAACEGAANCWFAGERLPGRPSIGAFHLHWDGANLTAVPSTTETQTTVSDPGRSVTSLAFHGGSLYEGVQVAEGDQAPKESGAEPSFLHQLAAASGGLAFVPLYPEAPIAGEPARLGGMQLAGDAEELWGVIGSKLFEGQPVTVVRLGAAGFATVPLTDPSGALNDGQQVEAVATEPGTGSIWVAVTEEFEGEGYAELAHVHADGSVDEAQVLPAPGSGLGEKGAAGAIACAAPEQCWMATQKGWLFHLGADQPKNEDPYLHVLVNSRPADPTVPVVPPVTLPEDNSGAFADEKEELVSGIAEELPPKRQKALYSHVKSKVVAGNVLELSFLLRVPAEVRLVAKLKGQVVAATKPQTFAKGKQTLRLKLDPKHWPTKIDLQVHRTKTK
ncbi:MAG TPA: hypothetical protein VGH14_10210 [Solirubrobacterales bacterium]|jgi:hypothetical protein